MSITPTPTLPANTSRVVILDTNAYRELTHGLSLEAARERALEARRLERTQGGLPLASAIVIWELAAHLADPADPAYTHCLNALVALAEHTRATDDPDAPIMLVTDSEWLVCEVLFGQAPRGAAENVRHLSDLALHIRQHAPTLQAPAVLANLQRFAAEMQQRESNWLADLQQALTQCEPAAAKAWLGGGTDKEAGKRLRTFLSSRAFYELYAMVAVAHYAALVGVTLTPDELGRRADFFTEQFASPFRLMQTLLSKLVGHSDLNLTSPKRKRGNFMWDFALCHLIAGDPIGDGTPVCVVTDDRAILEAATAAACAPSALSLNDYRQRIALI